MNVEEQTDATTQIGSSGAKPDVKEEVVTLNIPTSRFGMLQIASDRIVTFPDGMIGFEKYKQYTIVRRDGQANFSWLQSVDEPSVAFPLMEPIVFRPDYRLRLSESDSSALKLEVEVKPQVFAIMSIPKGNPKGMTANLLAPIVINDSSRLGKQVIVMNEEFTTRHEVSRELERAAARKAGLPEPVLPSVSEGNDSKQNRPNRPGKPYRAS